MNNYWFYPYKVFPFFVTSFALDVSLIPVLYMFVYQWTLNHKKNYYSFMILLSAFLAFVFKPVLSMLNLFKLYNGANYFHLFIGYLLIAFVSKIITNLFIYFEKNGAYKSQN
ncbi:CBO0543 family protein [Heyndrickxia acidiproducens]|uniref:CBO0543 family protein n=1 Tax=Heyndrickxia acidiproducens TaxID=1121084 RepID=UPI00266B588D|nr:CBO0543 family protein [Heyndrickxia acidiproducens]